MNVADALDRAIFAVAPVWGAKRMATRRMWRMAQDRSQKLAAWSAVRKDDMRGHDWMVSRLSPNADLEGELEDLRDKSADIYRQEPFATSAIEGRVNYEVGQTGITPSPRIKMVDGLISESQADRWNDELRDLFDRWAPHASRDGVSFTEWQRRAIRAHGMGGEAVTVLGNRGGPDKPIPLSLDLIESRRIASPSDQINDPTVRLGIKYDDDGIPRTVWIKQRDPREARAAGDKPQPQPVFDTTGRRRICHYFDQIFTGQGRGWPWLSPALGRLKDLREMIEAEITNRHVANCFTTFIKTSDPDLWMGADGRPVEVSARTGEPIEEISAGGVYRLRPEEDISFGSPNMPGGNFDPWMMWQLRAIAAALSYPYELLVKDYTNTTYSSGRLSLIDGRVAFGTRQQRFIESTLLPLWRRFVFDAVRTGEVSIDPSLYNRAPSRFECIGWTTPGWPWLDPAKEIEAAGLAVELNLSTLERELDKQGLRLDDVLRQRAREVKLQREAEIEPAAITKRSRPSDRDSEPDRRQPADADRQAAQFSKHLHATAA